MDALEDLGKQLEGIVDIMLAKGEEMSFKEVSALVGDICQQAQSEVDAWEKLEVEL
ncbi:hypothetical protein KI387_009296, partial [Taxus chinensis]